MKTKKNLPVLIVFCVTGFASLIWFLIRVIPKPSRALYPCQRAAFPVATSFIIWISGTLLNVGIFKKLKYKPVNSLSGKILLTLAGVIIFIVSYTLSPSLSAFADNLKETDNLAIMKTESSSVLDDYKSKVAIVKSTRLNASEVTQGDISIMVQDAINKSGGLENIIKDGNTVVFKPNLISDYSYADNKKVTPGANGMVTDYRVIQAVVDIVNKINPSGKIYLMEGSGVGSTAANMKTVGWDKITGLDGTFCLEDCSGGWNEYTSPLLKGVDLPDSLSLYPDNVKPNKTRTIYLNKIYYDADVLISIPVLKNHLYTGLTGAVKNVGIGASPSKIYGSGVAYTDPFQRERIQHTNRSYLNKWIHDFYACRPVDFVVMDGIQGFDNGPVGYGYGQLSQAQRNMRLILAGSDAIAVDAIEGLIMGHDPMKVPHLVYLHNDGFGCVNPACIEVVGEQVENLRYNFRTSDTGASTKFFDYKCRNYWADTIKFTNEGLMVSVHDTLYLSRIEVTVDGQKYSKLLIGDFSHMTIPLSNFTLSDSIVEITFIDKYLNTLKSTYSGNFTGISTPAKSKSQLKVYPTYATEYININWGNTSQSQKKLSFYSLEGKKVYTEIIDGGIEKQISVSNLKPGFYKVLLTDNGIVTESNFVKKR